MSFSKSLLAAKDVTAMNTLKRATANLFVVIFLSFKLLQIDTIPYLTISICHPMLRAELILSSIFFLSLVLLWVRT